MNDLQILTKAIQIAQKKGYRYILEYDDENDKHYVKMLDLHKYFAIIFDHTFAKAFFGEHPRYDLNGGYEEPAWEYHIKEMATCKHPLQYIKYYLGE